MIPDKGVEDTRKAMSAKRKLEAKHAMNEGFYKQFCGKEIRAIL